MNTDRSNANHIRSLSSKDKVLQRLEISQLLCLDEKTIPLLCSGLARVNQVVMVMLVVMMVI